jgi:hypothetical protein
MYACSMRTATRVGWRRTRARVDHSMRDKVMWRHDALITSSPAPGQPTPLSILRAYDEVTDRRVPRTLGTTQIRHQCLQHRHLAFSLIFADSNTLLNPSLNSRLLPLLHDPT